MATRPRKAVPGLRTDPFEQVRALCLALPEVSERPSHGQPAFFVRGRMFVTFSIDLHGDGEQAIWIKAAPGVQEMLLTDDPEHFFRPPYVGQKGTVAARLDRRGTPWGDIEALIRDAWGLVAPRRLAESLTAPFTAHPEG